MNGTVMGIERQAREQCEVVSLRGELDLTNAGQLADALPAAPARTVVLDLGGLAFIDSAGIRTIDRARGGFEREGGRLLIVAPSESRAGWTFRVAGLADDLVLGSVELALEAAAAREDGRG